MECRKGMNILQKDKKRQQIVCEINDIKHKEEEEEEEEEELQQWIDNKNAWIPHPKLPNWLFDKFDVDGNIYYTLGPNKYNLDWWYNYQNHCDQSYKYSPFATNYK